MVTPTKISPYGLIQEKLRDDPWKMLIACMMLNLTSIVQVRPIIKRFFELYPDAMAASGAKPDELATLLKPLGLYNRRSKTIIKFSRAWSKGGWKQLRDLPGVGKYAEDSYTIFVRGTLDAKPTDAKLVKYLVWANAEEKRNGQKGKSNGSGD